MKIRVLWMWPIQEETLKVTVVTAVVTGSSSSVHPEKTHCCIFVCGILHRTEKSHLPCKIQWGTSYTLREKIQAKSASLCQRHPVHVTRNERKNWPEGGRLAKGACGAQFITFGLENPELCVFERLCLLEGVCDPVCDCSMHSGTPASHRVRPQPEPQACLVTLPHRREQIRGPH